MRQALPFLSCILQLLFIGTCRREIDEKWDKSLALQKWVMVLPYYSTMLLGIINVVPPSYTNTSTPSSSLCLFILFCTTSSTHNFLTFSFDVLYCRPLDGNLLILSTSLSVFSTDTSLYLWVLFLVMEFLCLERFSLFPNML